MFHPRHRIAIGRLTATLAAGGCVAVAIALASATMASAGTQIYAGTPDCTFNNAAPGYSQIFEHGYMSGCGRSTLNVEEVANNAATGAELSGSYHHNSCANSTQCSMGTWTISAPPDTSWIVTVTGCSSLYNQCDVVTLRVNSFA
jgi:hypothetical protein